MESSASRINWKTFADSVVWVLAYEFILMFYACCAASA